MISKIKQNNCRYILLFALCSLLFALCLLLFAFCLLLFAFCFLLFAFCSLLFPLLLHRSQSCIIDQIPTIIQFGKSAMNEHIASFHLDPVFYYPVTNDFIPMFKLIRRVCKCVVFFPIRFLPVESLFRNGVIILFRTW